MGSTHNFPSLANSGLPDLGILALQRLLRSMQPAGDLREPLDLHNHRPLAVEHVDRSHAALFTDPHSVLSAVAEGNGTRGGIAGYLERKATDISHHLSVLEDAGLLARDVDVFRPGRSVYRISGPLIAFYHAIMRPE